MPSSILSRAVLTVALGLCLASFQTHAARTARDTGNDRANYSGSTMKCKIANDFYIVHFTAMQEGHYSGEANDFAKYCQEIPGTGRTFLSIDLLDRDVRKTPIALRVIEEEIGQGGQLPKEKTTLQETPAKIYKTGTVETAVNITQPGHYALIALIGDEALTEDDRLRIPFTVGIIAQPQPVAWPSPWITLISGLVLLSLGYFAYTNKRSLRRA